MAKTKVLRYQNVMISKFCSAGHLILIFKKRRIDPSLQKKKKKKLWIKFFTNAEKTTKFFLFIKITSGFHNSNLIHI